MICSFLKKMGTVRFLILLALCFYGASLYALHTFALLAVQTGAENGNCLTFEKVVNSRISSLDAVVMDDLVFSGGITPRFPLTLAEKFDKPTLFF